MKKILGLGVLVLALVLTGCSFNASNANKNADQALPVNDQNTNADINTNNNQIQVSGSWSMEKDNDVKKFKNDYLGVSFEIKDEKDEIKFESYRGSYGYLRVYKLEDEKEIYYFFIHPELNGDYFLNNEGNKYSQEDFEDYVEKLRLVPGCLRGTGAEMMSTEKWEAMLDRAQVFHKKIVSDNKIEFFIIGTKGLNCAGEYSNAVNVLVYYPDYLRQGEKSNLFYLRIEVPNENSEEIYSQIISTFKFQE